MIRPRSNRPGPASFALLVILVITAAWWALALWPAGDVEPEWLVRTRAACFGSMRGGLPDVGGWILLIGEPIGMVAVMLAVWGDSLWSDLRRIGSDPRWRFAGIGVVTLAIAGVAALGQRVTRVARDRTFRTPAGGTATRLDLAPPSIVLTDQHGGRTSLADFRGRPLLLTFAFGHCATVCPAVVHDLQAARARANRLEVPLLIVTLDPWRDTPDRLPTVAAKWALSPKDRILSGSVLEVERTLDVLGIGRRRDETTGAIDHGGTVMILDHRGHVIWRLDGGWDRVGELLASQP